MSRLTSDEIALAYLERGWHPIPLKANGTPLLKDLHGRKSSRRDLTEGEISDAFSTARAIGIVMPEDVIGIDVDHYGDKTGADDLAALEEGVEALPVLGTGASPGLGKLPPTWRSTARGASNPSGIRFFKVPERLMWREPLDMDIEFIWWGNRYARVWPSKKRDKKVNAQYWWHPDPPLEEDIPHVDWLPLLPDAWVKRFSSKTVSATNNYGAFEGDLAALAVDGHWCASVQASYATASRTVWRDGLPSYHREVYPYAKDMGRWVAAGCPGAVAAVEQFLRECDHWPGFRDDTEATIRSGVAAEQEEQNGCPVCILRAWKGTS